MSVVIQVDRLSKQYRLGTIGGKRLADDLNRWWAALRGRPDPLSRVGAEDRSGARKRSDSFWALRDVSFEVKDGEVLGIIGRNGAGKSTLLKILARVTAPSQGEARVKGRIASLLEVGTGFHPELTGRENIYLNGAILGMTKSEIRSKFDEIVAFSEVEEFIDTPVKRYSSGMHVRLAFAVAAHLEPEILIVDEVLAVGDAAFQKKCLGKMKDVAGEGRTILFVSHNMVSMENLCSHAILLQSGRITESGPAVEVIQRYLEATKSLSETSLVDRKDRRGAGGIRVTRIEILDQQGQPASYLASGESVIFRLHYACSTTRLYRDCRVWLGAEKEGRAYFMLATDVGDRRRLDLEGTGYLDYMVPSLPLSAGEYVINFHLEATGVVQDTLAGASPLSVVDGNFYGAGRDVPPGHAGRYVLVKFSWRLGRHDAPEVLGLQSKC
jgi:lipopolysaccharide transport system ATP-binding protein